MSVSESHIWNDSGSNCSSSWASCLNEARSGSREAQAQLLEAMRPYLLLVAQANVASDIRPKLAASDIVQDAVLQAWQNFGDFHGHTRAELIGWLRAILCNTVLDGVRRYRGTAKRDMDREQSLDQLVGQFGLALANSCTSPSEIMMASEESQLLDQAMQRLSKRNEQVIRLRNRLGLSFAEIGEVLSCSEVAARKMWGRAVDNLGQELCRNGSRDE
jgi:RNA polymerase sigma-70 factor (ECF subfamily)